MSDKNSEKLRLYRQQVVFCRLSLFVMLSKFFPSALEINCFATAAEVQEQSQVNLDLDWKQLKLKNKQTIEKLLKKKLSEFFKLHFWAKNYKNCFISD